jgi:hypothetical protein
MITNPSTLLASSTSLNTDILMSHFSPIVQSPQHSRPSSMSPSLHNILENIQTQIRTLSDRLDHPTVSRTPPIQSLPTNFDSRPTSCQSICLDPPSDTLSERFLRVAAEYHRLQLALAARPSTNNNNLPVSRTVHSPSSPVPSPTSVPTSSLPFSLTHPPIIPHPLPQYSLPSAFRPVIQKSSLGSSIVVPHVLSPSTVALPPVVINESSTHSPFISSNTSSPSQVVVNSPDATSTITKTPASLFPVVSSSSIPTTMLTMNLTNHLPTFKGLAHERPIQFINAFELRASVLVGNNDSSLLQTVQQALSDGALIWFGQVQKSNDRITNWTDFKTRFYERYHTSALIQNLRTELRLLFQRDNESTLDYFDRLKTLMIEIDPDCNDSWLKHKFIQKLRSDIRNRLDIDLNLPIRDIVRKAQNIESTIQQQQVDEKLKLAASQEQKNLPNLITNNLSTFTNNRQSSSSLNPPDLNSSIDNSQNHHDHTNSNYSSNNNNYHFPSPRHLNNFSNDRHSPNRNHQQRAHVNNNNNRHNNNRHNNNRNNHNHDHNSSNQHPTNNHSNRHHNNNNENHVDRHTLYNNNHRNTSNHQSRSNSSNYNSSNPSTHPYQPSPPHSGINNRSPPNNKTRYWCPHCQRSGHSWERCSANPNGINYRPNSPNPYSPSATPLPSSQPSSFPPNNSYPENYIGR